jgi:hypothetical protein
VLRKGSMVRASRMHSMLGKSSMAWASSMLHHVLYFATFFIKNILIEQNLPAIL